MTCPHVFSITKGRFKYDYFDGKGELRLIRGDGSIEYYEENGVDHWDGDEYVIRGVWREGNFQEEIADYEQQGKSLVYLDESDLAKDMPRIHGY